MLFLIGRLLAAATALGSVPATAQATPRTILFVGNSFTQGAHSPVRRYGTERVTDLNGDRTGGVPALFKTFADQAGLNYAVSLETQGGKTLGFHYDERRKLIDRPWDVVVLQDLSTFSRDKPGDPATHVRDAGLLAAMFTRANPSVRVELMATWTRADLTYKPGSRWSGKPVGVMADDIRAGTDLADGTSAAIDGVIPVGQAWNRAFARGVADPNPYDGLSVGQVNLWTYDHYHASAHGYYLEALVVFGAVTGVDPRTLGDKERVSVDLGLDPLATVALQTVAYDQLVESAKRKASALR